MLIQIFSEISRPFRTARDGVSGLIALPPFTVVLSERGCKLGKKDFMEGPPCLSWLDPPPPSGPDPIPSWTLT